MGKSCDLFQSSLTSGQYLEIDNRSVFIDCKGIYFQKRRESLVSPKEIVVEETPIVVKEGSVWHFILIIFACILYVVLNSLIILFDCDPGMIQLFFWSFLGPISCIILVSAYINNYCKNRVSKMIKLI